MSPPSIEIALGRSRDTGGGFEGLLSIAEGIERGNTPNAASVNTENPDSGGRRLQMNHSPIFISAQWTLLGSENVGFGTDPSAKVSEHTTHKACGRTEAPSQTNVATYLSHKRRI